MNHEIRVFRRGAVYHVTNRCYRGELRLSPDEAVNMFAEGCLVKSARRYGVRIIAFIVMGNHFHLIVEVPQFNLDAFMEYFQRELSRRLNLYRGVGGTNFPRRYRDEEIASVEDFERVIARMLCNPVRARLVGEAEKWPGVSSLRMHRSGQGRRVVRHATRDQAEAMRRGGETPELERVLASVELELSTPPFWADWEPEQVQERIAELVDAEEARLQAEIERGNERVVGPSRVLQESPDHRPEQVCWRAYRRVISRDPEYEATYHAWYEAMRRDYWRSARRWRTDGEWAEYPPGTFPPGWLECVSPRRGVGPPLPWQRPVLEVA